ncbi:hypothetical protein [Rhodoferax antarcticus]|uniref:hypothetical protein n=1 Tax=Rhodoferax antarcticus TaxID=81479 RepID=UPI000A907091|nr:hypothetical protein [Rhodoferax antarcticus]
MIIQGLSQIRLKNCDRLNSDDDLCATCSNCTYRPGELSSCRLNWPGLIDSDGYVQKCDQFKPKTASWIGKNATGDLCGNFKFASTQGRRHTIEYAIRSYGFLIERGESITPDEFCQRIRKTYDCVSNAQNAAVVDALSYLL